MIVKNDIYGNGSSSCSDAGDDSSDDDHYNKDNEGLGDGEDDQQHDYAATIASDDDDDYAFLVLLSCIRTGYCVLVPMTSCYLLLLLISCHPPPCFRATV